MEAAGAGVLSEEPKEKGFTLSVLLSADAPKEKGLTASVLVESDGLEPPKEKGLTAVFAGEEDVECGNFGAEDDERNPVEGGDNFVAAGGLVERGDEESPMEEFFFMGYFSVMSFRCFS